MNFRSSLIVSKSSLTRYGLGFATLAITIAVFATPLDPVSEVFMPPAPSHPENFVKVAVIQWNPSTPAPIGVADQQVKAYVDRNRSDMAARIQIAASNGAKFISLSEFAVVGYPVIAGLPPEEDDFRNRDDIRPYVDTVPGVSTQYFSQIAKDNHVWIQFGMAEVETATDKYFNTAVVINDNGEVVASFRKNTLYKLENDFLSAGTEAVTFDSPFGKVGLAICADIYNSSLLARYSTQHVDAISLSTSWAAMNSGMPAFISAAQSVHAYVLAANQTYFPDSGVINPDGTTQSHVRQTLDTIAYGYLPLKTLPTPVVTPEPTPAPSPTPAPTATPIAAPNASPTPVASPAPSPTPAFKFRRASRSR